MSAILNRETKQTSAPPAVVAANAGCRDLPLAMFFRPDSDERFYSLDWSPYPALEVCKACPVREECAEWAIVSGQHGGVFGGLTPSQLERAQTFRCSRRPVVCGDRSCRRSAVTGGLCEGHARLDAAS